MEILEIERTLIAFCLSDEKCLHEAITSGIIGGQFCDEFLGRAFEAMRSLWKKSEKVNLFSVCRSLKNERAEELKVIRANAPIAQNFEPYVKAMKDWAKQEVLKEKLVDLSRFITNRKPMDDFEKVAEQVFGLLSTCHGSADKASFISSEKASEESLDKGRERVDRFLNGRAAGIPTGFPTLDRYLYGLNDGMVYIIGARTSVGKTTLATNLAYTAASKGHCVGFLTVEMSASDIADKLICMEARVPMGNYLTGNISPDEGARVEEAAGKVSKLPIIFTEIKSADLATLEMSITRLVKVDQAKLIILDYLQLFDVDDGKIRRGFEATKQISKTIKQMARSLNVPFVVLSQLNRSAPEEGEPELIHIADSDQIARDSDAVLLLFREGDGHFISLAKNRRGKKGAIRLDAELQFNLFKEGNSL